MTSDAVDSRRAQEENWLPILELAIQEVFEIMLGHKVRPGEASGAAVKGEYTAMVGLGWSTVWNPDRLLRRRGPAKLPSACWGNR